MFTFSANYIESFNEREISIPTDQKINRLVFYATVLGLLVVAGGWMTEGWTEARECTYLLNAQFELRREGG